jgi:hypothetical protein
MSHFFIKTILAKNKLDVSTYRFTDFRLFFSPLDFPVRFDPTLIGRVIFLALLLLLSLALLPLLLRRIALDLDLISSAFKADFISFKLKVDIYIDIYLKVNNIFNTNGYFQTNHEMAW